MKDSKKSVIRLSIIAGVLLALLIIIALLQLSVAVCEGMTRTFARLWIVVVGFFLNWIPLSFYEIFLLAVFVFVVWSVVVIIKRLKRKQLLNALCMLLVIVIVALSFGVIYIATAGVAYNRDALPIKMYDYSKAEQPFTREQAIELAEQYIDNLNKLYTLNSLDSNGYVADCSMSQARLLVTKAYEPLVNSSGGYFSNYSPSVKVPVTSWFFSQFSISGLFFAPFGEVNVNGYEYGFYLPVTIAHEMAHSKGVMRESDANTVARYVCFTSDDYYLQYSAYLSNLYYVLQLVRLYPNTEKLVNDMLATVNSNIIEQYNAYVEYWQQFNLLSGIGEFFNNLYLNIFGQGGTNSYNPPADTDNSGEYDDEGNAILEIKSFSSAGNLIVQLYLDGKLVI